MGNCRSKKRNSPGIDRLGQDYPIYDQNYAGTSGLGQQFGLGGFGGEKNLQYWQLKFNICLW